MSNAFIVDDLSELLALQRVFREAKFCSEPDDVEVSDSPIVARLFERVISALVATEVERGDEDARSRWAQWLAIDDSRDEWAAAIRRARTDVRWEKFSAAERADYVRVLLSPFTVTPDLINQFESAVNRLRSA